ncbi:hypothetical protein CRG98_044732 [Punica granatum]|uniref:Uncharacterized protein n=1 Tax=Punica granatum TaxID=22663 RepID=A0A2I0HUE5_PUNGR|nr:hypothetical protein CRG98_044732 [Punica granatum]
MATKNLAISAILIFAMILMAFAATGEAVESRSCMGKCKPLCSTLKNVDIKNCPGACNEFCAKFVHGHILIALLVSLMLPTACHAVAAPFLYQLKPLSDPLLSTCIYNCSGEPQQPAPTLVQEFSKLRGHSGLKLAI